jgi:hypothetical protein
MRGASNRIISICTDTKNTEYHTYHTHMGYTQHIPIIDEGIVAQYRNYYDMIILVDESIITIFQKHRHLEYVYFILQSAHTMLKGNGQFIVSPLFEPYFEFVNMLYDSYDGFLFNTMTCYIFKKMPQLDITDLTNELADIKLNDSDVCMCGQEGCNCE